MGKSLTPWQRQAADVALELNPDGSWAYTIVIVSVQRQAGKTTLFGPVAHERAATVPDARCWWTAQTRQDARDSWMDMKELVGRSPLGQVAKIRESNGSEAVTYPSGGSFRVFAPSEDALHGKANELVAIDEAWVFDALDGAALDQAILPTFTTTGGQLWIISTAGTARSEYLRSYIERGRAAVASGRRDTVCLIEYGVPAEVADLVEQALTAHQEAAQLGDVPAELEAARDAALENLLDHHPAAPKYGGHLKLPALRQACDAMTPGAFLRAYGNHWTGTSEQVIPAHAYEATKLDATSWPAPSPGSVTLAVDVALDGASSAISAAWRPVDPGPVYVDVVEAAAGTSWVVDRVDQLAKRWAVTDPIAVDGSGPAADLADDLKLKLGEDRVRVLSTRDYLTACQGMLTAFLSSTLRHCGRPALDGAVKAAAKRKVGDGGWAFGRLLSTDSIAPLVACTIARWAFLHRGPAPERPAVVVRTDASRRRSQAARRAARDARQQQPR